MDQERLNFWKLKETNNEKHNICFGFKGKV